jgi:hypothetical protein
MQQRRPICDENQSGDSLWHRPLSGWLNLWSESLANVRHGYESVGREVGRNVFLRHRGAKDLQLAERIIWLYGQGAKNVRTVITQSLPHVYWFHIAFLHRQTVLHSACSGCMNCRFE